MSQTHKETLLKLQEPASVDVGSAADYIALMKPRVMSLVVFTALVGLVMAPGAMHPVMAVAAIALIAAGAGASAALNMWYDADIDAVMSRTKTRPVPSGRVTPDAALTFGLWVSGLSVLSMAVMINYLSAALLASKHFEDRHCKINDEELRTIFEHNVSIPWYRDPAFRQVSLLNFLLLKEKG